MHNAQQLSALTTAPNHNALLRLSHTGNLGIAYAANTPHLPGFCFLQLPLYLLLVQQLKKSRQYLSPLLSLPRPGKPSLHVTSQHIAETSRLT